MLLARWFVDTISERTLHFDLLPLDLGEVRGTSVRFEFYTVPGQTYYAATRRMVQGADGIVFVADSRREAMDENIESLNDLYGNLRYHLVIQNKSRWFFNLISRTYRMPFHQSSLGH